MCGIAGIVASDRLDADDRDRVIRMRDVIAHRGPDEAGHIPATRRPALAHRRLSIVDLAAGQQPLSNEDGTRLDRLQRRDLQPRRRPRASSRRTATATARSRDTETIVHAYEQWGDDCVDRFRGMFAFAIWDAPRRRLLLARDRLGVKPLYWALRRRPRCCSAPRSRRSSRAGWSRARAERARAARAARHALPRRATETLFKGIHKLLPGHTARLRERRGHDARSTGTCRSDASRRDGRRSRTARCGRAVPRAARGVGPPAADGRRAARHVPLGRHRQQRDRRADGADDRPAAADVLGRVQGARVQRARTTRAQVATRDRRRRARGRHRRQRLLRRAAAAGVARGRADRASVERAAVLRLGAGAPSTSRSC